MGICNLINIEIVVCPIISTDMIIPPTLAPGQTSEYIVIGVALNVLIIDLIFNPRLIHCVSRIQFRVIIL